MATRLFFNSEAYENPALNLPGSGWDHLKNTVGGYGSTDSTENGVLGYDIAYSPSLNRYLIVGDSGPVLYTSYMAWADKIGGPWNYFEDPTIYRAGTSFGAVNACTFFNGLFIAVADDFKIFTSTTAETGSWTQRYAHPTQILASKIVVQNGFAIVVGASGTIAYSSNGTTWTVGNVGTANICRDIMWDGTRFIAVAQAGKLAYSTSLAGTWTQSTVGVTNADCFSIAYSSTLGRYCVGMSSGGIRTTTTPLTAGSFTVATGTFPGSVNMIKFANDRFVAVGDRRAAATSTNGTAFTVTLYNNSSPSADIWACYNFNNDNTWLAVTEYYPSLVWRSTDNGSTFQPTGTENSINAITAGAPTVQRKAVYSTTAVIGTVSSGPPATVLKKLKTEVSGALNHTVARITTVPTTVVQTAYMGMFASEPLKAQTVGGGTLILNTASSESSLIANFWNNCLNVYVWRPSTGQVVGYIRDGTAVVLGGLEPPAAAIGSAYVTHITGITTSSVVAQSGDIIVCEVWSRFTQGMATAFNAAFFYNGSTVNTTPNALVTSQASFVEFSQDLIFKPPPFPKSYGFIL